jgi:hypothetical protein
VYDVTIGYPEHIVASEMELLKQGHFPESVHFDIKRYDIGEICGHETDKNKAVDASKWLTNLWRAKEQRLKDFYEGSREFKPSGDGFKWPVRRGNLLLNKFMHLGLLVFAGLLCNILLLDRFVNFLAVLDIRVSLRQNLCTGKSVVLSFLDIEIQRRARTCNYGILLRKTLVPLTQ